MLASIRRFSKSKAGSFVLLIFIGLIALSFAAGDVSNVLSGNIGGGGSSSTLATVGSEEITDAEMSRALEQRLRQVRAQNPEADYASLAGDFDPLLTSLIDERALSAFAEAHGFSISPRLVGAEIAKIPAARGLDGRFSQQAYQAFLAEQRLSDLEVRNMIRGMLLQRMILAPLSSAARVPVGVATPYASMLLEARQGELAFVPIDAFRAGLQPTDSQLQQFYAQNRARYTVPEQRVLRIARISPEQVTGVAATDEEIAAYYRANQAQYAARDIRTLSQAVAPDQATAQSIASRAKAGGAFAAAAAPAGFSAEDVALGEQTREQLTGIGGQQLANAVFSAAEGAIVGPIRTANGWNVVKVESIRREGGRTLEQARSEIAERLTAEKRKAALETLVDQVQTAIDTGANFAEAAAAAKLPITETPPITANGTSRTDASFRMGPELQPVLRTGFELTQDDDPVIDTLANDAGYAIVAPARIVPAAPAPLASIVDRVRSDWIDDQARRRAQAAASQIAAKVARNMPLAQAVREAGVSLPAIEPISARRIQLTQLAGRVPPPLQILFSLGQGKSRMVADGQGQGFYVVKVNRIVPGNAITQPALITTVQRDFQQPLSQEYAQQFLAAIRKELGVERNASAIAAAKQRIIGGGQ
jgi:peptidyl-prolyl cis-trans isomerase D